MRILTISKKKKKKRCKKRNSGITYTGWGNNCGGFKPPAKGEHLDTQLFPGCKAKNKPNKIIEAKHGEDVMELLRKWRNKEIDNEDFVVEIARKIEGGWTGITQDQLTRKIVNETLQKAAQDQNYEMAANKIATFLGYTEKTIEPGELERKKRISDEAKKFNLKRFRENL